MVDFHQQPLRLSSNSRYSKILPSITTTATTITTSTSFSTTLPHLNSKFTILQTWNRLPCISKARPHMQATRPHHHSQPATTSPDPPPLVGLLTAGSGKYISTLQGFNYVMRVSSKGTSALAVYCMHRRSSGWAHVLFTFTTFCMCNGLFLLYDMI